VKGREKIICTKRTNILTRDKIVWKGVRGEQKSSSSISIGIATDRQQFNVHGQIIAIKDFFQLEWIISRQLFFISKLGINATNSNSSH